MSPEEEIDAALAAKVSSRRIALERQAQGGRWYWLVILLALMTLLGAAAAFSGDRAAARTVFFDVILVGTVSFLARESRKLVARRRLRKEFPNGHAGSAA